MVQIHPKRAYLNSSVVISNKGQETVFIKDALSNESFELSPGEFRTSRYAPGKHNVTIKTSTGTTFKDFFVVEDALKFGGSERKKCFIFDNNSWAIIVMKDRTYFLNEESQEQFVEYNLSPDCIEELSQDYLLFITGRDCSLFSLSTMSIEKTMISSSLVYHSENHCVFADGSRLIIYHLNDSCSGDQICQVTCNDYCVCEKDRVIYSYDRSRKQEITIIKFFSSSNGIEQEIISSTPLSGDFVCFNGNHSVLYTKSSREDNAPNEVYSMNLSAGGTVLEIYKVSSPITYINGKEVYNKSDYSVIWNKYLSKQIVSGTGNEISIEVIDSSESICYIINTKVISIKKGEFSSWSTGHLYAGGRFVCSSRTNNLTYSKSGKYTEVKCEDESYLIYDGGSHKVSGAVCYSIYGEPYIRQESSDGPVYKKLNGELIQCDNNKSEPSYGLFFQQYNNRNVFYWLKTGERYLGEDVKRTKGLTIVSGGLGSLPSRLFLDNGNVLPLPGSIDDLISISHSGESILFEKGGYLFSSRYDGKKWNNTGNFVLSIYDTLKIKDAVFVSDGDSFVYQKDNEMVLFDFTTEKETVFPVSTGITYNINGYRPYCSKDFFSRPVIIDPLTHQTVDNAFLYQYRFSSIDQSTYCEGRVIRRLLYEDDSEITDYQYMLLRQKYDYPIGADQDTINRIRQDRIQYLEEKKGATLRASSWELGIIDFVDRLIAREIEFVIINKNGSQLEIQIGTPLYYLNYVSFSADTTKVAICGKYKDASGLCLIYDLDNKRVIHRSTNPAETGVGRTKAIWLGLFSCKGDIAYYDSSPNTFVLQGGNKPIKLSGRSFLTFSPSGKYMALSKQGYTPYQDDFTFWGHNPSCDIYIHSTDDPEKCLFHFNDHGDGIIGVGARRETVASASFSCNDQKLLSVSRDGVVVVRNLHLETDTE